MNRTLPSAKEARRCQSCGMPLVIGFYGTKRNQGDSREFCRFCFQNGAYTDQDMTLEKMIEQSVRHMISELRMPENKARALAKSFIPKLKRWSHS
jgi:hypothetical protein